MVAGAGRLIRGILEGMQAGYRADPDVAFAPLSAWLSKANWGGVGRGVGLRRAPNSLLDAAGNPSPYLADNAPYIISQAQSIGPELRYDMLREANRLEERRKLALMPEWEREEYFRHWTGRNPDEPASWDSPQGYFALPYGGWSNHTNASVDELVRMLASKDYAINVMGHDPRWYEDEFMYNNWARAHDQIMTFADALRNYDFSQVQRGFENPYYGRVGSFLPRSTFVPRPFNPAPSVRPPNMNIEDIPF